MSPSETVHTDNLPQKTAAKVTLAYLLVAAGWILGSDHLLNALNLPPAVRAHAEIGKGLLFVMVTGGLLYFYLVRSLKRLRVSEAAVLHLYQQLAGATGQDYFSKLTRILTEALDVDLCVVGEWHPPDDLTILASHPAGTAPAHHRQGLQGTPCATVLQQGQAVHLPSAAAAAYPEDALLQEFAADGYLSLPLRDDTGEAIGMLSLISRRPLPKHGPARRLLEACIDRTSSELRRIRSERRIKEQFEQFTTLFDALNAAIYVADLTSYQLLYVNRFAERTFGEHWLGKSCYSYFQQDQDQPCGFCTNPALLDSGQPTEAVVWEFRNPVSNRWYQCIDKAIRWTDDRLVRLEIAIDITERKELEQVKDEMLSAVSHEMRTPLTAITGFSELLLEEELAEPVRHHVATIFAEAERLGELINTFIDVRRLKTDRSRVGYEPLAVDELLRKGAANCRDCTDRHELQFNCPAELQTFGNRRELIQVIAQLVANACRYSPGGGPITLSAEQLEDSQVRIAVTDRGIGIPAEHHDRIFERFHRLDNSDRRRTGGTGLGLTLAREVIALHGGSIRVSSQPGQGSTFYVTLPGQPARPRPEIAMEPR